ncbi:hypothetical protein LTR95_007788 [Oleoguttula sp. CCFEE 5521]
MASQQDPTYALFLRLPVYQYRIAVHNLGVQVQDEKSENHLTIYLLLGGNRSFHLDMQIRSDTDDFETAGMLRRRPLLYNMSNTVIKFVDIDAVGCPAGFRPDQTPSAESSRLCKRLGEFVTVANRNGNYRFTFMDGHPLGCRTWVQHTMEEFRRYGLIGRGADYERPNREGLSLMKLITHRWDLIRPPQFQVTVPGLLLRQPPSSISHMSAMQLLAQADDTAVNCLLSAVGPRAGYGDLDDVVAKLSDSQQRRSALEDLVSLANERGFEISHAYDMLHAEPNFFTGLHTAAEGRYRLVVSVIVRTLPIRQRLQTSSTMELGLRQKLVAILFTNLLAAVVDMSGPEDAEDSD